MERVRPIEVVVGAWAFPWEPHGTLHGDLGLPGEEQAKVLAKTSVASCK